MARTVRVKVGSLPDSPVKVMNEDAARRLVTTNPNGYKILEEPKVEVLNLPPLTAVAPEKKSVVVAEVDKEVEEKRKPGRPKQNP